MTGMSQVGGRRRAEDVASGRWRGGEIALKDVLQVSVVIEDGGIL
jgi:hypothetical protein